MRILFILKPRRKRFCYAHFPKKKYFFFLTGIQMTEATEVERKDGKLRLRQARATPCASFIFRPGRLAGTQDASHYVSASVVKRRKKTEQGFKNKQEKIQNEVEDFNS